jgi:hypothetical protein
MQDIMTENLLETDIQVTDCAPELTPYAGLVPFLKMCRALGLHDIINQNIHLRDKKGYKDSDHVLALIAEQFVEGSTIDDLAVFKEKFDTTNLRSAKPSVHFFDVPSPSATREYLSRFHNTEEETKQKQGKAYIPIKNEFLAGFEAILTKIFQQAYKANPKKTITLDQDATFIKTGNKDALYNYHGEQAYEAFNTYCPEYDMIVGTEFRDGNVNPGYGQLEELKRVLSYMPEGVEKIKYRSDSAGYQTELLRYCAEGKNERFGVIDFTISCPVGDEFKKAVKAVPEENWHPVMREVRCEGRVYRKPTGQEYADVVYVPSWAGNSKNGAEYRFIAIREVFKGKLTKKDTVEQRVIPELIEDLEGGNEKLKKLHLTNLDGEVYKIFGIVTNMLEEDRGELVLWHHQRCGKAEEIHRILKDELAGGHVASRKFGANAAWWNIAVLASSLLSLFKHNFLPPECGDKRPKALKFRFFMTVGRWVKHAGKLVLRVYAGKMSEWFEYARARLMSLSATTG